MKAEYQLVLLVPITMKVRADTPATALAACEQQARHLFGKYLDTEATTRILDRTVAPMVLGSRKVVA